MKKKVLSVAFAIMAAACFCIAYACASVPQARFKENPVTEVALSDEVNLEDYIVKEQGYDYKVTVKYEQSSLSGEKEEKTETFTGMDMIFCPKTTGEHTLVYEVIGGKKKTSATLTIRVVADAPKVVFSKRAVSYELKYDDTTGRKEISLNFGVMMADASMVLRPVTAETTVVKIERRELIASFDESVAEWEEIEFSAGESYYTFTETGRYRITVRATSGEKTGEDFFYANVLEAFTENEAFGSGRNVIESENDPYTVMLTSGAMNDLSYVAVKEDFDYDDTLNVVFKGKAAPQLGLYVEAEDGYYGVYTAAGAFFSFKAKSSLPWVFYAPNMFTGSASKTPGVGRADWFGLDNLEDDKTYLVRLAVGEKMFNIDLYEVSSFSDGGESVCVLGEHLFGNGAFGGYSSFGKALTGKAVIYGDIDDDITVKYVPDVNVKEAPKQETEIKNADGTVIGYAYKATYDTKTTEVTFKSCIGGQSYTDCSYLDLGGGFTNGGAVAIEFTGMFPPQVAFMVEKGLYDCDTKGMFFSVDREADAAPFRVYGSRPSENNAFIAGNSNCFTRNDLNNGKKHVMLLAATRTDKTADWRIEITLYEKGDDGKLILVKTHTATRTRAQSTSGDHIVLYGSRSKDPISCKFTVSATIDGALKNYTVKG